MVPTTPWSAIVPPPCCGRLPASMPISRTRRVPWNARSGSPSSIAAPLLDRPQSGGMTAMPQPILRRIQAYPAPGVVVVPIWDVDLGRFAAHAAFRLLASGVAAVSPAATAILEGFFAAAAPANFDEGRIRLIEAATRRGIPWARLIDGSELLRLGQGARQVRLLQNYTSNTGFIATRVATNKDIATRLLRDHGLPVPANQ